MLDRPAPSETGLVTIHLRVNGCATSIAAPPFAPLAETLRERLGLMATKIGCDAGDCGACTVLLDGEQVCACLVPSAQAEGSDILTIEGVAHADGTLHPMQAAFKENHGLQCGFCTPGMVMNALEFAKSHPSPSEQEVRESLEGNLCRCTGYHNIVKSIMAGARAMAASK